MEFYDSDGNPMTYEETMEKMVEGYNYICQSSRIVLILNEKFKDANGQYIPHFAFMEDTTFGFTFE